MKKFVPLVWKNFALLQTTLTQKKRYAHSNAVIFLDLFIIMENDVHEDGLCNKGS